MIKGEILKILDNDDAWNCALYILKDNYLLHHDIKTGIYRSKKHKSKKYQLYVRSDVDTHTYFPTFKEAAICFIELIKNDPKYIPDIMRVTALMSEEK